MSWTGANNLRWKLAKADQPLAAFDQEANRTKRSQSLKELEKEILEQVVFILVYHLREATVVPKASTGLVFLGKGTRFMFPENWKLQ